MFSVVLPFSFSRKRNNSRFLSLSPSAARLGYKGVVMCQTVFGETTFKDPLLCFASKSKVIPDTGFCLGSILPKKVERAVKPKISQTKAMQSVDFLIVNMVCLYRLSAYITLQIASLTQHFIYYILTSHRGG